MKEPTLQDHALQNHVDSFKNVDTLWEHLFRDHHIEGRGPFIALDDLHLNAHIANPTA